MLLFTFSNNFYKSLVIIVTVFLSKTLPSFFKCRKNWKREEFEFGKF